MGFWDWLSGGSRASAAPTRRPARYVVDRGVVARGFNAGSWLTDSVAHHGMDIAAPEGTPVHAAAAGTIIFADVVAGLGNVIMVRHSNRATSVYSHLADAAAVGDERGGVVRAGQQIGRVGRTIRGYAGYAWVGEGLYTPVGPFLPRMAGEITNGNVMNISPHLHLELWASAHPQIVPVNEGPGLMHIGTLPFDQHGAPVDPAPWLRQIGTAPVGAAWSPARGAALALH